MGSSSEKIPPKRFIKKQIFFDFVPPPLNYFEYTMNELYNIEKSLNRVIKPNWLEPSVSKYMSFSFVYGNHMNVTKASLALFDAEPGEKIYLIVVLYIICLFLSTPKSMIKFNLPLQKKKKKTAIKVE